MKKEKLLELWELEYQSKVDTIRAAIDRGYRFYINTCLGRMEVASISKDGNWAYTVSQGSNRSWAICSTEINCWFYEILKGIGGKN